MSPVNIHDAFVPIYLRGLQNAAHIVSKAEAHAKEHRIPETDLMQWRLAPDMEPLAFQVQTICGAAHNLVGLVTDGIQSSVLGEDHEGAAFSELHRQLHGAIAAISGLRRGDVEGRDAATVVVLGRGITGLEYVQKFGVPNFFFHINMMYAVLRSRGVRLGKGDYLRGGSGP
jgi:uncharacterized protein